MLSRVFLLFIFMSLAAHANTWQESARLLSSENQQQVTEAIQELRKTPDLEGSLGQALHRSDQELALQVIQALQLKKLVPALIAQAKQKPDWTLFATIHSLSDSDNAMVINSFYEQELSSDAKLDSATRMALLDGLKSAVHPLPLPLLSGFLNDKNFDLRIAATQYAGARLLDKKENQFADLLREALGKKPKQVRVEALVWMQAATEKGVANFAESRKICIQDSAEEVRAHCQNLGGAKSE